MTDKKAEQEKDSVVKKLLSSNLTWSVVALIVLIIICTISDHQFLSLSWNKNTGGLSGPLITMLQESARYLMIATGMTLVISTAGIDLSVGSVMAVAGAAAMQLLSNDPMAFARCMLGHTGWLGRHLLRSVRMSGLDIFWTVTADEASATAELFGAEMALANNLLALVQQYIRVQSDRLWLEPDFTGERAGERIVSFRLTSCAAVLLWLVIRLLHRLWKDPQLQPAAKA